MKKLLQILTAVAAFVQIANGVNAAIPTQDDYKVESISINEGVVLEAVESPCCLMVTSPSAVAGEIYTFSNPLGELSG